MFGMNGIHGTDMEIKTIEIFAPVVTTIESNADVIQTIELDAPVVT